MDRKPFDELKVRLLGGGMTTPDDALSDVGIGLVASPVVPVIDVHLDDEDEPVAMIVAILASPQLSSLRNLGGLAVRAERARLAHLEFFDANHENRSVKSLAADRHMAAQAHRVAVRAHVERWPEKDTRAAP